jgi:hypothetical protein
LAVVAGNLQTVKVYINGELVGTANNTKTITGNIDITVGHCGYSQAGQNRFNAYLSDYSVYNREVPDNEILSLFETSGCIYYELNLNLEEII